MKLILAPMEGVVDYAMRELLTHIGGYDLCVTEFLRVSNNVYPESVFYKICPELRHDSHTRSGTPVRLQLLGQSPSVLAANAKIAVNLGVTGIDLNFGCPAKTVNKHKGGAVLLDFPEQMYQIIKAVREAVPYQLPVSAKIRLGLDCPKNVITIAKQVELAGADQLFIHARTKKQGYRPPAYWHWIKLVKQTLKKTEVIANGEVWSNEDYQSCKIASDCQNIMIGRGALANPKLAYMIKNQQSKLPEWLEIVEYLVFQYEKMIQSHHSLSYYPARTKQWLNYLKINFPEAHDDFNNIKSMKDGEQIRQYFLNQLRIN